MDMLHGDAHMFSLQNFNLCNSAMLHAALLDDVLLVQSNTACGRVQCAQSLWGLSAQMSYSFRCLIIDLFYEGSVQASKACMFLHAAASHCNPGLFSSSPQDKGLESGFMMHCFPASPGYS